MQPFARGRRTPLGQLYTDVSALDPFAEGNRERRYPIARDPTGRELALYDLTACDRFGLKGRGAGDWLRSKEIEPPPVNTMIPATDDLDLVRLGSEDFVVLSRPDIPSTALSDLRGRWEEDAGRPKGFNAWREEVWAWFHLCGDVVSGFMAKTCPVDLRRDRFSLFQVAQTRVTQMDCIVIRTDRTGKHGFDLFFDVASCEFALRSFEELGA